MRKQLNVRVPQRTIDQISEIVDSEKFESQSHAIMVAIEKMYESELEASVFIGDLEDEKITIYAFCEPDTEDIRYIGQTYNLRLRVKQHIKKAKKGSSKSRVSQWLASILESGKKPTVKIIDRVDLKLANQREETAIQEAIDSGHDLLNHYLRAAGQFGGLLNSNNGGKMPLTNSETQLALKHRRQAAYKFLKELALKSGAMEHWKDSSGYDEFIEKLESGELKLKMVKNDAD